MVKVLTTIVDDELHQKITKYCFDKRIKKKEFMVKAIEEFLKKEGY
jgi:hypothetical protein